MKYSGYNRVQQGLQFTYISIKTMNKINKQNYYYIVRSYKVEDKYINKKGKKLSLDEKVKIAVAYNHKRGVTK